MDTYREYKYLNELLEEGKAPGKVWEWVSLGRDFLPTPQKFE
jgi:hypothetical protein